SAASFFVQIQLSQVGYEEKIEFARNTYRPILVIPESEL
ncbi:hypothetical protein SAMN04488694_1361, partial [Natrinema hispanicum]